MLGQVATYMLNWTVFNKKICLEVFVFIISTHILITAPQKCNYEMHISYRPRRGFNFWLSLNRHSQKSPGKCTPTVELMYRRVVDFPGVSEVTFCLRTISVWHCSVGEKRWTFPMGGLKCLMGDFPNLYGIYKAHQANVWWTMKVFRLHWHWRNETCLKPFDSKQITTSCIQG